MINIFYQYYLFEQPHLTSHNKPQKKTNMSFPGRKSSLGLGHAQKAGLNQLMQYQRCPHVAIWISKCYTNVSKR